MTARYSDFIMQGIPLIMETPVQEREPPVNYKLSLQHGRLQWKDPGGPYGVGQCRNLTFTNFGLSALVSTQPATNQTKVNSNQSQTIQPSMLEFFALGRRKRIFWSLLIDHTSSSFFALSTVLDASVYKALLIQQATMSMQKVLRESADFYK